jgi:transposase-like protein
MEAPKTLQQAIRYYSDEQVCIDKVAAMRWPDGPSCPACEKKDHYYLKTQKRWKCKECGRQFSVKLGTIFEDSPLSLDKWLCALWMLVNCRNGVSSYEVARDLGVTQKSAWFMLHRLRFALQTGSLTKLGGSGAPVEVDETFIGGKARNMHKSRRIKMKVREHNWAKTVVMGMLERGGRVKTAVIPERRKKIVEAIVRENIAPGSEVHTDEFPGYMDLQREYVHKVINHLEGYVDGKIHTQELRISGHVSSED